MARGRTSISNQPQFRIQWRDVNTVQRDLLTGMSEEDAAKAHRAERPMLVYVYDVEKDDQMTAVEEDRAFQSEKVAVGARFFDCLRIASEDAANDRLMKPYAHKAPCLVFVRPNYEVAATQTGRFNGNRVFKSMCATMKKDYSNCVNTVLKKQREIQRDRASLQRDKDKLAQIDEKLADTESKSKRSRLVKQRDELEKQVVAAEEKLNQQESSLYKLEPKETAKTTS